MHSSAHMINIGNKAVTDRIAIATGRIILGQEVLSMIQSQSLPKGDALAIAEIAGISGAKQAHSLIPLCHPLELEHVGIRYELEQPSPSIQVFCIAAAHARTGVEMEALAGVQAALLTIYDLAKMVEPALTITDIHLLAKKGGKHSLWTHPDGVPEWVIDYMSPPQKPVIEGVPCSVITLSDRAYRGSYPDTSGPVICEILKSSGVEIAAYRVLPDDEEQLSSMLSSLTADGKIQLIITSGGTGISPRDYTPDIVTRLCRQTIPGIGELLRQNGAMHTPYAWLSRTVAGIINKTLVIALPGNPNAVQEGMECLLPILPHMLSMLAGENHD